MICPACGFESPEAARFCGGCGTPLERRCPECGAPAAPGISFCTMCGTRLDPAAAPSRLPSGDDGGRDEERKVVTALFADLVGFTGTSEQLDPEDVRHLLLPYYARLRSELERFGGTVEKFIGDAVMALFGAPIAHEDDPERAVRAALAIRDAMVDISDDNARHELRVRIGITTGEALVTLGARPSEGEGMAAGDVINTASRLQSNAPVNGILVDEATYRATHHEIDYGEAEPVHAKGKAEPIRVWLALEPRARLGVDVADRGDAPLVGRAEELDLLVDALARARHEPGTQLVTLVGVPGIGKSRLVAELAASADAEPDLILWRQGRSLPYGEGVTYWALTEMAKAQAGILETDSADAAARKLARAVRDLIPDPQAAAWVEAHVRPLVGLAGSADEAGDRRGEAFAAWRRFLEALAERSPLVLVFEDLHWADDNLLDFVDYLVDWAGDAPLLVVCTARPELLERRPGWGGGKRNASTVSLSPLNEADTARLIGALLEQAVLPAEAQAALLQRAGGNPLYAAEYVRMLEDRGILQRDGGRLRLEEGAELPMPESVQGIVAARLDALPPGEKALLQDAAVAGKVVWLGALAAVSGRPRAEVEERLHALERKEFVRRERRSSVATETQFAFSHVLVRDVAYQQIPRGRRADKHRRVAEWIESLAAGRADDLAEMLAHHYVQALDFARASGAEQELWSLARNARLALRDAGDRAYALSAFAAAERFYREAFELWPEDDPERPELVLRLGRARHDVDGRGGDEFREASRALLAQGKMELAAEAEVGLSNIAWLGGDRDDAFLHIEAARQLVEAMPPSRAKAEVLSQHSRHLMLAERDEEAIEAAREALGMAEALGLDEIRAHALDNLGCARCNAGDLSGIRDLERSIAIATELNSPEAIRGHTNLATQYAILGDLRRAGEVVEEGIELGRRLNQQPMVRFLSHSAPLLLYHAGRWQEALSQVDAHLAESAAGTPHYLDSQSLYLRGRMRLARGDVAGALEDAEGSLERARRAKDPQNLFPATAAAAVVFCSAGQRRRAEPLVEELLSALVGEATGMWSFVDLGWALRSLGRERELLPVLAAQNPSRWVDAAAAVASGELEAAADVFAAIGSRVEEANARLHAAEQLVAEGRRPEAEAHLDAALAFFASVGASASTREAEALLAASA